jgi:hypothetical protein
MTVPASTLLPSGPLLPLNSFSTRMLLLPPPCLAAMMPATCSGGGSSSSELTRDSCCWQRACLCLR